MNVEHMSHCNNRNIPIYQYLVMSGADKRQDLYVYTVDYLCTRFTGYMCAHGVIG